MLADGQLWRLPVRGEPQSLTTTLAEEVEAWCAPFAPWRMAHPSCDALRSDSVIPSIDDVAMRTGRLALRLLRDDVFHGEFAFLEIGRAPCREWVCQYEYNSVVVVSVNKKHKKTITNT